MEGRSRRRWFGSPGCYMLLRFRGSGGSCLGMAKESIGPPSTRISVSPDYFGALQRLRILTCGGRSRGAARRWRRKPPGEGDKFAPSITWEATDSQPRAIVVTIPNLGRTTDRDSSFKRVGQAVPPRRVAPVHRPY